jgi:hypothetical protein
MDCSRALIPCDRLRFRDVGGRVGCALFSVCLVLRRASLSGAPVRACASFGGQGLRGAAFRTLGLSPRPKVASLTIQSSLMVPRYLIEINLQYVARIGTLRAGARVAKCSHPDQCCKYWPLNSQSNSLRQPLTNNSTP